MKIKSVAVIIENNIQYESFKNAIDIMIEKNINVDIFIPTHIVNDGFNVMFDEFYEKIKKTKYHIFRVTINKKYDILFQPYLIPQFENLERIYTIKYMYGLTTKPEFSLALKNNFIFDAFLCYGNYDAECLKNYGITFKIGNLKYLNFKKNKSNNSKKITILYLPTYDKYSSINLLIPELKKIENKYNILIKPHHGTEYLENDIESKHRDILKSHFKNIFSSKYSLDKLLNQCDIVLTDQSGAVFDAVCVKKPVIMYYNNEFKNINSTIPLPIIYAKKGYFVSFNNLDDNSLEYYIDLAMDKNQIIKQNELFSILFVCENNLSKKYFLKFINQIENNYISNDYYEIHQILKRNINQIFNEININAKNYETMQNTIKEKESYILEIEEKLNNYKKDLDQINNKFNLTCDKLNQVSDKLCKTNEALNQAKSDNNLLNNKLLSIEENYKTFQKSIYSSKSWKITKPFRYLSKFLKK